MPKRSDAPAPIATSVSMLGAPWIRPFVPCRKNLKLSATTGIVSRSCVNAADTGLTLGSKNAGTASPAIGPMAAAIRITHKTTEV